MNFQENCDNGNFLDGDFNGSVDGFLIGPDFYSNPLNVMQRVFYGILFSFLSATAIIGNGLALFTTSERKLQVLYKCCVFSQCIGDLLTAVFVGLNSLNNFIQETIIWNFGDFMCSWIPYVTTMSALLSSMILTCIAIDRYQGVILLSGKWNLNFSAAATIVGCVWAVAAGATVPTFLGYNQIPVCFINFQANTSYSGYLCIANQTISNYYFFTIFILIFLPLLIAFTVLYGVIARTMWLRKVKNKTVQSSKRTLETNANSETLSGKSNLTDGKSGKNRSKKKVCLFTVILVIMGTFIVCRLPQWIFIVVTTLPWIRLNGNISWNIKYLLSALSLANTAINPLIYSFLNEVTNFKPKLASGLKNFNIFRLGNVRINLS